MSLWSALRRRRPAVTISVPSPLFEVTAGPDPDALDAQRWAEMPETIRWRAVRVLQGSLCPEIIAHIRGLHERYGRHWIHHIEYMDLGEGEPIPNGHMSWGLRIRNFLRGKGLLDRDLPSGNWADYYVQVIECAAGLRLHTFTSG